jgi:hypothetical protein
MDKVVLDGTEYVKASAVAKQFHYTSDYIGQLCRAKKVDARLVGRTWFVNPDSIEDHKQTKQKKDIAPTKKPTRDDDIASKVKINRVEVEAPLKNKTVKATALHEQDSTAAHQVEIRSAPTISYHQDAETLLPTLKTEKKTNAVQDEQEPTTPSVKRFLHVEPASAKKLKIAKTKQKEVSFNPTELPDVALSGKLKVYTYDDISTVSDETVSPDVPQETPVEESTTEETSVPIHIEDDLSVSDETATVAQVEYVPPSVWVRLMPLAATSFAVITSFALLSVAAEVTVFDAASTSNLSFEIEQFLQLFAR